MNTKKRKSHVSGRKYQGGGNKYAGLCTVLHDYEKNYGQNLIKSSQSNDHKKGSKQSKSPSQKQLAGTKGLSQPQLNGSIDDSHKHMVIFDQQAHAPAPIPRSFNLVQGQSFGLEPEAYRIGLGQNSHHSQENEANWRTFSCQNRVENGAPPGAWTTQGSRASLDRERGSGKSKSRYLNPKNDGFEGRGHDIGGIEVEYRNSIGAVENDSMGFQGREHGDSSDDQRDFRAKKSKNSVKERLFGVKCQDLDDSLAQYNSNVSFKKSEQSKRTQCLDTSIHTVKNSNNLQEPANLMVITDKHCFNRHGDSPSRQLKKKKQGQDCGSNEPRTLNLQQKVSTCSTVVYESHVSSVQTPLHLQKKGFQQKNESPVHKNNTLSMQYQTTNLNPNIRTSQCKQSREEPQKLNPEILFSFNQSSSQDQVDRQNDSSNKTKKIQGQFQTVTQGPNRTSLSPERHLPAEYYFGSVQEKTKNQKQWNMMDILNYGRAKRDEILERLQVETTKKFNELNKSRAKSSGNLSKAQNHNFRSKKAFKLQKEPMILEIHEQDLTQNPILKRSPKRCTTAFKTDSQGPTQANRLYAPTKSSQAKLDPSLRQPPNNYGTITHKAPNPIQKPQPTPQLESKLILSNSQGRLNTMTTPKSKSSKPQRALVEDRGGLRNAVGKQMQAGDRQSKDSLRETDKRLKQLVDGNRSSSLRKDRDEQVDRHCMEAAHQRQTKTRSQGKHQGRKSRKAKQNTFNPNNLVLIKMTRSRSSTIGSTRNQKSASKTPNQKDKKTVQNDLSNKMGKLIHRNFSKGAIANSQASSHQRKNMNSTNESKLKECDSSTKFKDGGRLRTYKLNCLLNLRHNNQKKSTVKQSTLESELSKSVLDKSSRQESTLIQKSEKLANKSPIDIIRESMTTDKHCENHKRPKSPKKGQYSQNSPANIPGTKLKKHPVKSLTDDQLVSFIKEKLLAVMLGYKTRTIYGMNRQVKQYRQEYRDLIQFAFSLKQEMSAIEGVRGQETQYEITKQLLFQSLKDLIHKKQQFSKCFNKIFKSGTQWLDPQLNKIQTTSNTEETNRTFRSPQKGRNSQKNQQRSGASVGQQSTKNIVLSFSPGKKDPIIQDSKLKKDHASATRNYTQSSLVFKNSSFSYDKTGNSMRFSNQSQQQQFGEGTLGLSSSKIYTSEKTILKRQGTFHQSQMTFGTNNLASSIDKNEKIQESETGAKTNQDTKIKLVKPSPSPSPKKHELSQVSEERNTQKKQPEKKHTFLKKGEKTRKVYDPQRAIQMENMAKRQASQSIVSKEEPNGGETSPFKQARNKSQNSKPKDFNEITHGSDKKLKQILSRVSVPVDSQKSCLTPTKQQPKHVFSRFQTTMREEQTVEKLNRNSATPKSQDSHMKRMKEIRETYQSPYKQLVNQSSGVKESQIDNKNKNFVEINRDRVASMATDSRKMSLVSSTHCHRDPILDNTVKSFHTQIKSQKDIDKNENVADQINHRRDSCASQNQFVSKIPRLRCSISRDRGSIPRERGNQSPQKSPQKVIYQSQTSDPNQVPKPQAVPRGSFTNCNRSSFHQNPVPQPSEPQPCYPNYQSSPSSLHPSSPSAPYQAMKSPVSQIVSQKVHQRQQLGSSGVPPVAPGQTRGASQKQSQMHKKTPSLMEMNEKIKMQNQLYIQQQLSKGNRNHIKEESPQKQTQHKSFVSQQRASLNLPFNYSNKIVSAATTSQENLADSRDKIRETAKECVRKTRESTSVMSMGRRQKHSAEKKTPARGLNHSNKIISEQISHNPQLVVQASGKTILQLNNNNGNQKASLRYQNPKPMSDISGLSQPTSALDKRSNSGLGCQNQMKGDKSTANASPSRPNPCDISAFHKLIGERLAGDPNDSRSSMIDRQYDRNSFGKQDENSSSNVYHTNGTSHAPECSSPPHKPLEAKYRSSPEQNEPKAHHQRALGSRLPCRDPSEKQSIIHQASNLQHILDKFSPLRSASFENNNFQRRKSFNYKTKNAITSNNDCQHHILDQCASQKSIRKIESQKMQDTEENDAVCDQDMKSSDKQEIGALPLSYQIDMHEPKQIAEVFDAKGFQTLQIPANESHDQYLPQKHSIPCHNINQSIGMFNMKNKCLDLGRSSNFDSLTNSNLPSQRMLRSPQEKHHDAFESSQNEYEEIVSIPTVTIKDTCTNDNKFNARKSSIMEITNSYIETEKHHRNQTALNAVHSNQDTTKTTWQHHPIGSQVFKTPSICSTSTFHLCPQSIKNKSSSMSSSYQASSRQSAMVSARQNDTQVREVAASHAQEAKNVTFNYKHVTAATKVDDYQQSTVLYQEKEGDGVDSQQRRVKYSPQNRGQKVGLGVKQSSPLKKINKENRVAVNVTDVCAENEPSHCDSHDMGLIMPQIISGTTKNHKSRQPGALRNKGTSEHPNPLTSSTFSRRRRSKAERSSKQGVRSRRQGCEEAAALCEAERGMFKEIGNTEESAGTAEKRSGHGQCFGDEVQYSQAQKSSQYKSRERAQESPSFSPRKANQFSALTTPANKRKQQSQCKFDLKQFSAQGGTSNETSVKRQRLTQTKRSRECQAIQSTGSP